MKLRFRADNAIGKYAVSVDGKLIGYVRKRAQHYNLRRAVTVHYWTAETAAGKTMPSGTHSTGYPTRSAAADVLIEEHNRRST